MRLTRRAHPERTTPVRSFVRRLSVVYPVVLAAVVTTLLVTGTSSGHVQHSQRHSNDSVAVIRRAPVALARAFPVLRKAHATADAPPPDRFDLASTEGVNLSLSQEVLGTASLDEWLAPGRSTSCLIWTSPSGGGGFGCAPNAVVETRGLVGGVPGRLWVGVLPTGTTAVNTTAANGATGSVSVNFDGGFAQPLTARAALSYLTASGQGIALPAGPPPRPATTS